jgi:hypothetical protein
MLLGPVVGSGTAAAGVIDPLRSRRSGPRDPRRTPGRTTKEPPGTAGGICPRQRPPHLGRRLQQCYPGHPVRRTARPPWASGTRPGHSAAAPSCPPGWNAERILLASEALGDGYWFTRRGVDYANSRGVFGRQIGTNQGVAFPITDAYMRVRAADMMRYEAARLVDAGEPCGAETNTAKHLASEASWAGANACLDTHGGYGFLDEYDVERKFRETGMFQVAPVNNNMIKTFVATKVLDLPWSY